MDYNEKLRLARKALDSGSYDKETIEFIFPELKESEDERIKNLMIKVFKSYQNPSYHINTDKWEGMEISKILSWLEKQGEKSHCNEEVSDEVIFHPKNFGLQKQGEQKPNPYSGTSFEYNGHTWGMCARDSGVEILIDSNLKAFISLDKTEIYPLILNKTAPKFKIGDWVVPNNGEPKAFRVEERGWPDSIISGSLGNQSVNTFTLDKQYHLWTIQDAKEGDVLADDCGIYIFEKFDERDKDGFVCIGAYQYSQKVYECGHMLCYTGVHPATKEQRDQLEKAMANAGYRWN